MKYKHLAVAAASGLFLFANPLLFGEVKVVVEHNNNETATPRFQFKQVPLPSKGDAAAKAKFSIIEGEEDDNGGGLEKLHDDRLPTEPDEPSENFFFDAGTKGGRLLVDLGKVLELKQVNTYSWHPDTRGPQVYQLYVSDGTGESFKLRPAKGAAPDTCGWKLLTRIDTRPSKDEMGGQYGVSISDSSGSLGSYRYLLFDMARTEADDEFGNTFYSEIDVIDAATPPTAIKGTPEPTKEGVKTSEIDGGKYRLTIDTSKAPDLKDWAIRELEPVVQKWYPKLVHLLPGTDFEPPKSVSIAFRSGHPGAPAATSGARIICSSDWFRHNLNGEAKGAVVHELVHVVQQYHPPKHSDPNFVRPPGWLVEGIPDYIRWFKYEPERHGADLVWLQSRKNVGLKYDAGYRVSANFLNWVSEKYMAELVPEVNAALRAGKYNDGVWKQLTGHSVYELADQWKKDLEGKLAGHLSAGTS
jgi:hypothetical protein